jgi:hypothetical protein
MLGLKGMGPTLSIRMCRAAFVLAVSTVALAAQANAASVQCPSVSFTRTPVRAKAHRSAHPRPHGQTVKHRSAIKRPAGTVVAKGAAAPHAVSNPLPVLAPILPPDTLPATTPVLAPGVPPATPILGYRLKRSVKMVACEPVPLVTASRNDLTAPPGAAIPAETALVPASFQSPQAAQFGTLPGGSPGILTGTPGGGDTPPGPPPSPVPEPATWAMLIVGFFGLGAQLRRSGRRVRPDA